MSKFLYPIYKLKTKSYIKWWLYHKKAGGSGVLSEILEGFSFNLENTLNRKFNLFEIEGNSVQDGTPSPDNEVPILSAGDNGSINEKIKNADGTKEQDYSIFVQKPMMDDDHFDRKNNKEVHTWIKYVLDGSDDENWSIRNNKFFIVDNINYSLWEKSISPNGKSNIGVISYSVLDNHTGYGLALAYGLRLNLENIDASNGGTIEQLRAYLAEHPITIYVKLKDSAYEKLPCTPEQIQQLENKPSTYKDFTIIQSQDETPAYLKIQYYKEG